MISTRFIARWSANCQVVVLKVVVSFKSQFSKKRCHGFQKESDLILLRHSDAGYGCIVFCTTKCFYRQLVSKHSESFYDQCGNRHFHYTQLTLAPTHHTVFNLYLYFHKTRKAFLFLLHKLQSSDMNKPKGAYGHSCTKLGKHVSKFASSFCVEFRFAEV